MGHMFYPLHRLAFLYQAVITDKITPRKAVFKLKKKKKNPSHLTKNFIKKFTFKILSNKVSFWLRSTFKLTTV